MAGIRDSTDPRICRTPIGLALEGPPARTLRAGGADPMIAPWRGWGIPCETCQEVSSVCS
jgi:hypothetical protein